MTEEQIQEMVEEVERQMDYAPTPEHSVLDYGNVKVPGTDWNVEIHRIDKYLEDDSTVHYTLYLWCDYAEIIFNETVPPRFRYDTPTDAIRAAIAMIDRLEAALQEDA